MKNFNKLISLFSISLIAATGLASCNTEKKVDDGPTSVVGQNLEKLRAGFTLNGVVTQTSTSQKLDLYGFPVGDPTSQHQKYKVDVLYENSPERTGGTVTHTGSIDEMDTLIDYIGAYVDENGDCYQEYLDYKNEVQTRYIGEEQNNLTFVAAGLFNFATILNEEDFEEFPDLGGYLINTEKMGFILKNLLGHVNSGFFYTPSYALLTLKDGVFDTLMVKLETFSQIASQDNDLYSVSYDNKVEFTFNNIGTTKLPRIQSVPHKPENEELKKALAKIGDNYTLNVESTLSIDKGKVDTSYRMFKFDGEQILVNDYNQGQNPNTLVPENHFILKKLPDSSSDLLYCHVKDTSTGTYVKKNHKNFAKNYQGRYYYEDLLIQPSIISSDFFTYDNKVNEYVCDDDDILSQIKPLLIVSKAPLANEQALNAFKVGIRINNQGNVEYIRFYVNYQDLFNATLYTGYVKVNISDLGATRI